MTKNAQSKQGVENPTSADIRCYTSQTASEVATVPAGSTIHYVSTQQINHPGPTQYYLARVPAGSSAKTFDGSGAVWFKIATAMPTLDKNKQLVWPAQSMALPRRRTGAEFDVSNCRHVRNRQRNNPGQRSRRRVPSSG